MIDLPKLRAALADYNSARQMPIHEWNRIGRTLTDSMGPLLDLLKAHERVAEAAARYMAEYMADHGPVANAEPLHAALANLDAVRRKT